MGKKKKHRKQTDLRIQLATVLVELITALILLVTALIDSK